MRQTLRARGSAVAAMGLVAACSASPAVPDGPRRGLDGGIEAVDGSIHAEDSPIHAEGSPIYPVDSPIHAVDSPIYAEGSPIYAEGSPIHAVDGSIYPVDGSIYPVDGPIHPLDGADAPFEPSQDAGEHCSQTLADGSRVPASLRFLEPAVPVRPFYQWESNNGYCGEVSLLEAGMNHGQWLSQYSARLACGAQGNGLDAPVGAPLLQSGPEGFCSAHRDNPDYNAQLLLESAAAASAAQCLSNVGLAYTLYPAGASNVGLDGFKDYLAWVKGRVIAGDQVTVGVFEPGGTDSQYDHIVTVVRIGTNHAATDGAYYDDDVLYLEDHGAYTFRHGQPTDNPAVPPGAGRDHAGCTPYVFAYAFADLPATREQANADSAPAYTILIPGVADSETHTGGNGVGYGPRVTGHNYGFAVSGLATTDPTLPVTLAITGTRTNGAPNPESPLAGYDYESPYIGTTNDGSSCTDEPPASWMTMTLEATVSGLTPGVGYTLYEYDLATPSGVGSAAALDVPTASFNASASQATHTTPFVAAATSFTTSVTRQSDVTVVFRAVPADAP